MLDQLPWEGFAPGKIMSKLPEPGAKPANVKELLLHESFKAMLRNCWNYDPAARPTMEECSETISSTQCRA